jgi:hypothetical protein
VAKLTTRKHVDPVALSARLAQIDLPPGVVSRHNAKAGEWEIETADPAVSDADLARVIAALPESPVAEPPADGTAVHAERRAAAMALLAKAKWNATDTEAAVRLLLTAELERS